MRFVLPAFLAMAVSGCTGASQIDALDLKPSNEIVSSIGTPTPKGKVSDEGIATALNGGTPLTTAQAARFPEAVLPEEQVAFAPPPGTLAKTHRQTIYRPRFSDAKPVSFKGASPKPFEVHGVDVSKYQGDIDWHKLRRHGASFAFIKATEGDDHMDVAFEKNWKGAANAGIPRGAYHFYYWCSTAKDQAAWFIRNVPKAEGALPPVIDVEWNAHSRNCRKRPGRTHVLSEMKTFMEILERHYGVKPIIYTAPDFYADNLRGQFSEYSFWLRSVVAHPKQVYPDRDWAFWQYSGTGLSGGVDGHIDLNVFNGTAESWQRWIGNRAL